MATYFLKWRIMPLCVIILISLFFVIIIISFSIVLQSSCSFVRSFERDEIKFRQSFENIKNMSRMYECGRENKNWPTVIDNLKEDDDRESGASSANNRPWGKDTYNLFRKSTVTINNGLETHRQWESMETINNELETHRQWELTISRNELLTYAEMSAFSNCDGNHWKWFLKLKPY